MDDERTLRRRMDDARVVVCTAARLLLEGPRDDIAWSLLRRDLARLKAATDAYYSDVDTALTEPVEEPKR